MPVQLHAPSLYLATALINAIAALLMLRALRSQREPFLAWLAGHAALFAAATAALGLREAIPDPLTALVAPALALLSLGLLCQAVDRLRHPPRRPWLLLMPPALWFLGAPLIARGDPQGYVALYSAVALALALGAARSCWLAHRGQQLGSARDLALVLLAAAGWFGWRLAEALLVRAVPLSPLAGLVTVVLGTSIAFLGLAIARERAGRAEADALRRGRAEVERLHAGLPAIIFLREILPDGSLRQIYRGGDVAAVTGWPPAVLEPHVDLSAFAAPGARHRDGYAKLLRDGEVTFEWQIRQPEGGHAWIRTLGRVLERRPDGTTLVVGYAVNIEAERRATEATARAQGELERTLAAAPVAVFRGRVTPEGAFVRTYLSQGIERLTGWPWETVNAPGGLHAILEPEKQVQITDNMRDLLQTGESRRTYRIRRADGDWMWARTTLAVLERLPDGGAEVVGYIADITPEREADAKAAAAGRLASLGEMATGLAHELKQPLQTMSLASANAMRALDRGDAAAARPRLERIIQQVARAGDLIEHLRRFARGAPADLPPGAVALATAVGNALMLVGAGLREDGVSVELALGEPPPTVLGHAVPLEQVLVNLLANARDALAARPAGAPRRIRIAAEQRAETVRLTIADTGGGIPEALAGRLFEPFVSTKEPDRGTGLGLSICHGLVKAMGGGIEARNDEAGAVFVVTLPAAPAIAGSAPAPEPQPA